MTGTNGHSANGARHAAASSAEYGKTAGFLAVGVGITGVMTYGFFLVASHTLSNTDYGQISILWSAVFITISTLCCPIEQLLSRQVSERMAKGNRSTRPSASRRRSSSGSRCPSRSWRWRCGTRSRTGSSSGNETLYWVYFWRSSSTRSATSPAASWRAASASACSSG